MSLVNAINGAEGAITEYMGYSKAIASGENNFSTSDPATLLNGELLLSNADSTSAARQNLASALSYAQTASSSLGSVSDMLSELKALSIQANNGVLTQRDRANINAQAQEILSQIGDMANTYSYNGQKYLRGGEVSVAADSQGNAMTLNNPNVTLKNLGLEGLDLSTAAGAEKAIKSLDGAIDNVSSQSALIGAQENAFEEAYDAQAQYEANMREAGSKVTDTDIAWAATQASSSSLQYNVATSVQSQAQKLEASRIQALLP